VPMEMRRIAATAAGKYRSITGGESMGTNVEEYKPGFLVTSKVRAVDFCPRIEQSDRDLSKRSTACIYRS